MLIPRLRASLAFLALVLACAARANESGARAAFRPGTPIAIGHAPLALAVGDLDGDGRLDVALASDDSTVTTLLGDGTGGLRSQRDLPVAAALAGIALGRVDADARLDAVVSGSSSGAVITLLGAGDGSLVAGPVTSGTWTPASLALRDLDGDGHVDAVVADLFFGAVVEARGDGTGAFAFAS